MKIQIFRINTLSNSLASTCCKMAMGIVFIWQHSRNLLPSSLASRFFLIVVSFWSGIVTEDCPDNQIVRWHEMELPHTSGL